jgi:hypothetical protein
MDKFFNIIVRLFPPLKTEPPTSKEAELGLFSQLMENPTFQRYLNAREDYLVRKGMEDYMAGNLTSSDRMAGQVFEIRNLRNRVRSAYVVIKKLKGDASLKTESKTEPK